VSVFEFLLALYAIVAGLGVSLLVQSIGQMIEARGQVQLYWVHSCWLAFIFLAYVVSWFAIWRFAGHSPWTVLQALLMLLVPILLYLVSHLAVPNLDDGRVHDMREYYYRHVRWTQSLLLATLVCGTAAQNVIEGRPEFVGPGAVRAAVAVVLLPGIVSRNPLVHGIQAIALIIVMVITVSYIARPIGG
jgi:hypothetical protein